MKNLYRDYTKEFYSRTESLPGPFPFSPIIEYLHTRYIMGNAIIVMKARKFLHGYWTSMRTIHAWSRSVAFCYDVLTAFSGYCGDLMVVLVPRQVMKQITCWYYLRETLFTWTCVGVKPSIETGVTS